MEPPRPPQCSDAEVALRFLNNAPKFHTGHQASTLTLNVRLATILYGGGPRAGYPDEITPFRPSSIRGHLRFWWRATRGGDCATWEELRKKEGRIWGDTDQRSPVRIQVDCPPESLPELIALESIPKDDPRRYALFPPYNEKNADLTKKRLQQGGGFCLTVSLDAEKTELREDVEAALWAWLNFGGLGARTRRGAGALFCPDYSGWDPRRLSADGQTRPWPKMRGGKLLCGTVPSGWQDCWRSILRMYRNFRQDRPGGRVATLWPEPGEIRAMRLRGLAASAQGFPRGALGMPVLFQFRSPGDPSTQTLAPDDTDRMASPVILRPLAISATQAVATILILNTEGLPDLSLYEGLDGGGERKNKLAVPAGSRDAIAELISRAKLELKATEVPI